MTKEKSMWKQIRMKELAEEIKATERTARAVRREMLTEIIRGPKTSQVGPMMRREKMEPAHKAIAAASTLAEDRWRSQRMTGRSGDGEGGEEAGEGGN